MYQLDYADVMSLVCGVLEQLSKPGRHQSAAASCGAPTNIHFNFSPTAASPPAAGSSSAARESPPAAKDRTITSTTTTRHETAGDRVNAGAGRRQAIISHNGRVWHLAAARADRGAAPTRKHSQPHDSGRAAAVQAWQADKRRSRSAPQGVAPGPARPPLSQASPQAAAEIARLCAGGGAPAAAARINPSTRRPPRRCSHGCCEIPESPCSPGRAVLGLLRVGTEAVSKALSPQCPVSPVFRFEESRPPSAGAASPAAESVRAAKLLTAIRQQLTPSERRKLLKAAQQLLMQLLGTGSVQQLRHQLSSRADARNALLQFVSDMMETFAGLQ